VVVCGLKKWLSQERKDERGKSWDRLVGTAKTQWKSVLKSFSDTFCDACGDDRKLVSRFWYLAFLILRTLIEFETRSQSKSM